jgi:uncharacterized membrane protein YcaP (DUF421 family)
MWHHIWHLQVGVGEKVARAVLIYLFLIVAFRVFGKRELGQSTTLDLAVLLLVANAVQNGIIGDDISVTGALIGACVLFGLNRALADVTSRWDWLSRAVEGTPTTLIEHGHPVRQNLRHEQISLPELRAIARRQGFPDLGAVHTAVLETNGTVSMFREDEPGTYHPDDPSGLRIGKRRRAPAR